MTQEEFFYLNLHVVYIFKQELEARGFAFPEPLRSSVLSELFASCPQQWVSAGGDDSISLAFISLALSSIFPTVPGAGSLPGPIPGFNSHHISAPVPPCLGESKSPPSQSSSEPCLILHSCPCVHVPASANLLGVLSLSFPRKIFF